MELVFVMPGDQDWDETFWEEIGVGSAWEKLSAAFNKLGVEYDDSEDITLVFPAENEAEVRKIVQAARTGQYGPAVQKYWTAAREVKDEEVSLDYDVWAVAKKHASWGEDGFDDYVDEWERSAFPGDDLSLSAFEEYLDRWES